MAEPYWTPERVDQVVSARARILGPQVWAAATPDPRHLISFAGGLPDIPSLPADELLRAARTVLDRERKEALEYGGTFGPLPLRDAIAERWTRLEGVTVTRDHVIIASGSAHAIGMVCETLLDPGDIVMVESPNFPGSMRTIRSFGAEMVAIPLDADGMRTDVLEEKLAALAAQGRRAKFIYCIPNHQNPAGCTMSLARREHLPRPRPQVRHLRPGGRRLRRAVVRRAPAAIHFRPQQWRARGQGVQLLEDDRHRPPDGLGAGPAGAHLPDCRAPVRHGLQPVPRPGDR
jgi:hypothetical protein